nr:MAG TPA: hypothetical protein [Caudoviricetes sp.]
MKISVLLSYSFLSILLCFVIQHSSAYLFIHLFQLGYRTLLGILYLFNSYAVR